MRWISTLPLIPTATMAAPMAVLIAAMIAAMALLAPLAGAEELGNPMPAVRLDQWMTAAAAVEAYPDPVARKLVAYYRLLSPHGGRADEIAAFEAANPGWPNHALLERRRQEALATEADPAVLTAGCAFGTPTLAPALLRCAEAAVADGRMADAPALARAAWITAGITDPVGEAAFLQTWGSIIAPSDQVKRFEMLAAANLAATNNIAALIRQAQRLPAPLRAAAGVRVALQRNDATAAALGAPLAAALPHDAQSEPGLFLDLARYLRHANRDDEAVALWAAHGAEAQAAPDAESTDFWAERGFLARKRLRDKDYAGAYALVTPANLTDTDPEALFLAGFLALRFLHDTNAALAHFRALAALSPAAITQGRAYYWIGRAESAAHQDPHAAYAEAARHPYTFYGQLAARALGEPDEAIARRINAETDPAWTPGLGGHIVGKELTRAAALLIAWGETPRARAFLLRLEETGASPAERAALADFALTIGSPETAVAIARRMGRDGILLPQAGWPVAVDPPAAAVDPAVALGLIRQESSFDAGALSPVGARGLMQLMPATAQTTAKHLNLQVTSTELTSEPALNMQLGTAYLREMLDGFGGALPLAVAAYNAGPTRVQEWLGAYGDPRAANGPDMLDWMETIPFTETRNYVQRVLENIAVYRAKRNEPALSLVDSGA
jgi:soluble lytic murein transglycosylase